MSPFLVVPSPPDSYPPKFDASPRESEGREHLMNQMHERPVVNDSNQDKIRQGETGHHVRYILIISCILVVLAFVAVDLVVRS